MVFPISSQHITRNCNSMAPPVSVFRQYTSDDSFLRVYVPTKVVKEYQIALTYATACDDKGDFRPSWELTKVTSKAISQFKNKYPDLTVKVFICIGNKEHGFPFSTPHDQCGSWITTATRSLTNIIRKDYLDLKIDGIDVLYDDITAQSDDFVKCISEVIHNLKYHGAISVASISPSSHLNKEFYVPLFNKYPNLIDLVDYQFQNEEVRLPDPDTLWTKYNDLTKHYTKEKLFAGYSAENEDWDTVSPIVFFLGATDILQHGGAGFSIVYHNYYKPKSTHNHGCIIS